MQENTFFVRKTFNRFFWPSLVSSLGLAIGGIADAIVVGRRMGEVGLAAIGFATPIYMVFNTFDVGLGMGGAIHYNRLISTAQEEEAVSLFNRVLQAALVISIALAILGNVFLQPLLAVLGVTPAHGEAYALAAEYANPLLWFAPVFFLKFVLYYFLRNDDNPRLASFALVTGNIVDFALNIVLVLVLDLGVAGAAYSSIIGSAVVVLLCIPHFFLKGSHLRVKLIKPSLAAVRKCFATGFASSSQYVYQFITMASLNNIVMRIGGSTGVAVLDIVINVSYIVAAAFDSITATLQPMVSTFYGERNTTAVRQTLRASIARGLMLTLVAAAVVALAAEPICRLFGLTGAAALDMGNRAIRLYCLSAPMAFFSILMCAYYQSVDQERMAYVINLLRSFVLLLAFALLLSMLGIGAFWWVYVCAEGVALLVWGIWSLLRHRGFVRFAAFDTGRIFQATLDSENKAIGEVLENAVAFCEQYDANPIQQYFTTLTVEEMCVAIIDNAFTGGPNEYIQLTLIALENGDFELHIRDSARTFNPFDMKTRQIDQNDDTGLDALGVLMVKEKAKKFHYQRHYEFNTLTIIV